MTVLAGYNAAISVATGASTTYTVLDGVQSFSVTNAKEMIDITAFDDGSTRRRIVSLEELGISISGDAEYENEAFLRLRACYRAEQTVYIQAMYDSTNGFMCSFLVESLSSDSSVEGKVTFACELKAVGDMSVVELPVAPSGEVTPTVTIDAQPYTRMVAMGSYTLTGTTTNTPTSMSWSASPSGASGSITPGASWSAVISISPDAVGEGVETITVTATNGAGSANDTETIGFYVSGAHSWFSAQNVDGSYNSTLANLDPITTWQNLGSSALDITQSTAGAKPSFKTNMVGGQPTVSGDGGDYLVANTASDWRFLHEDTLNHVYGCAMLISGTTNIAVYGTAAVSTANEGAVYYQTVSNDRISRLIRNATPAAVITQAPAAAAWPEGTQYYDFDNFHDGTLGTLEGKVYVNGSLITETTSVAAYSSGTGPTAPLTVMASSGGNRVGAMNFFVLLIYNGSALDSTQRGINHAVTEWALGGTLPLLP